MADHSEEEDGGAERGERGGEGMPPETQGTRTVYHPPRMQGRSQGRRLDTVHPPPQGSPYALGSMSASLPDVRYPSYQRNPVHLQPQLMASEGLPSLNQEYGRMPLHSPQLGRGVAPSQYFGQPYQQAHQMEGYQTNYAGGSIAYAHPHGFAHPLPQPLQQLQPQQPVAYGHVGTGYYPVQHQFARPTYDNPAGVMFRQEHSYPPLSHTTGPPAIYGAAAVGPAGSAPVSRPSSESSAASTTLRGPPRKPRQSGHALWCGNLPAQTNIVELKDHFSRDATDEIESVFLISKSNCAFINYKSEESCTAALARFHESRFQGAKLVCRLRRGPAAPPAGTPTGPRSNLGSIIPSHPVMSIEDPRTACAAQEDIESNQTTARMAEEKFFVMKSLTVEDLDSSVRSGSWATQSQNEAALNAAYKSARNVYLVFSANKSGEYHGYARMLSGIDDNVPENPPPRPIPSSTAPINKYVTIPTPATEYAPKGYIIDDPARGTIFWEAESDDTPTESKDHSEDETTADTPTTETADSEIGEEQQSLGHPFKIEWISTEKLPFHRARGLCNPWNQNREVKIARDGREIEPSVGRRLVNLFHTSAQQAAAPPIRQQQLMYPERNPQMPLSGYPRDPRFGRPY